jgi:hypothetical protein
VIGGVRGRILNVEHGTELGEAEVEHLAEA